jgi:hypothetical protein
MLAKGETASIPRTITSLTCMELFTRHKRKNYAPDALDT